MFKKWQDHEMAQDLDASMDLDTPPTLSNTSSFDIEETIVVDVPVIRYQYKPLRPGRNEIRLIQILPSTIYRDTIHCEIFTTPLESAPPYRALSYNWGAKSEARTVFLNRKSLRVTRSLKKALERLRPRNENERFFLWADAICINQDDVPERNDQTAKMRLIYQNADSVAVWIGVDYEESSSAMKLAHDLNCFSREQVATFLHESFSKDQLDNLIALFRRQYWWRVWVIQEVACAKTATVYCGSEEISWSALTKVCDILKAEEDTLQAIYFNWPSSVRTLTWGGPKSMEVSRYSPESKEPPLLELLYTHKSKKSTDPRDKVFALVGISSSCKTFLIDYSQPIRNIYLYTARHIITTTCKLDVICVRQHDLNNYNLPSWAPDWTRPPRTPEPVVIGLQHSEPHFTAAGETLANASFSKDGSTLYCTGILLDTISTLGTAFKRRGSPNDVTPLTLQTLSEWWNLFLSFKSDSVTDQGIFCRTISCGNWSFSSENLYTTKLQSIASSARSHFPHMYPPFSSFSPVPLQPETQRTADLMEVSCTMNKRRFIVSEERGIVGLVPWNTKMGDKVVVLEGCRFPVVLRERTKGRRGYILVGEAYVDGWMWGEAVRGVQEGNFRFDAIEIY